MRGEMRVGREKACGRGRVRPGRACPCPLLLSHYHARVTANPSPAPLPTWAAARKAIPTARPHPSAARRDGAPRAAAAAKPRLGAGRAPRVRPIHAGGKPEEWTRRASGADEA